MVTKRIQLLWPLFDTHSAGWVPLQEDRKFNLFPYGRLAEYFHFLHQRSLGVAQAQVVEHNYLFTSLFT